MRLNKFFGCVSAFVLSSALAVSAVCSANKLENANKGDDYYVAFNSLLPEGCQVSDAKYAVVVISGAEAASNGGFVFNTENGKWTTYKWTNDNDQDEHFPDKLTFSEADFVEGQDLTFYRPIDGAFDNPGNYAEVVIQHYWPENTTVRVADVYLADENKQRLTAKTAETEAPAETTAAPSETTEAPAETTATSAATTAASTTASTTKAATAKASTNPDTGDSGVALAVAAAFAAAGVAVSVGRKKER